MSDHVEGNHQSPAPLVEGRPAAFSDRVRSLRLPDQASGGRRGGWLPWALCALFFLSTVAFGYQAMGRQPASAAKPADPSRQAAESGDVALESKGYIIPAHQIQVSPKVGGMVVELYIEEGKQVKEGDVLAQIEIVDYKADRDRAAASLDEAKQNLLELSLYREKEIEQALARWDEAEVQSRQLEIDSKRSARLRSGSALGDREAEQAESAHLAMKGRAKALRLDYELLVKGPRDRRIEAVEKRIRQAEAELTKAQWRLDNCTVRAPVSGTILTKKAEKGNIVNPAAFNVAASLCDMADLSDLEVELTIQERDIAQVHKDQRCRITTEAFRDRPPYEGYVSRLMPIADRAKGAIPVRVKVLVPRDEEGVYLKPEMGVIVSFLKGKDKSE